jgi:hypothetical protein
MSSIPLTAAQQAEAEELAARIRLAFDREAEHLARLVVSKETKDLFGQTEFDLRERLLQIGAKVYELYLAEKKTATKAAVSSARTASKRPSSKATGRGRR